MQACHQDPNDDNVDVECCPKCLAHSVFGGVFLEQVTCTNCRATSEPKLSNILLHYIYASDIFNYSSSRRHDRDLSFSSILNDCLRPVIRACPSSAPQPSCAQRGQCALHCLDPPRVLAFCVTWENDEIKTDYLQHILAAIETTFSIENVFETSLMDGGGGVLHPGGKSIERLDTGCTHSLNGIICYYGRHYICFCKFICFNLLSTNASY